MLTIAFQHGQKRCISRSLHEFSLIKGLYNIEYSPFRASIFRQRVAYREGRVDALKPVA